MSPVLNIRSTNTDRQLRRVKTSLISRNRVNTLTRRRLISWPIPFANMGF